MTYNISIIASSASQSVCAVCMSEHVMATWDGHSADSSYIKDEGAGCKQGRRVAAIRGENKAFCLVVLGCFVCGYNQLLRNMMQEIINIAGGSKNDVSKIKHS